MKRKLTILILLSTLSFSKDFYFLKQNSIPKYHESSEKKASLCGQIYTEIIKNLKHKNIELKIDDTLYPIKRILLKLERGSGHIFCGAGKTKDRKEKFIYSKRPVYSVNNVVMAHASENFIPVKLEEFGQRRIMIGAYFGTSSSEYLKSIKGIQVNDSFTDPEDAFKLIEAKKLRYFFYHDLALNYAVENSNYHLKVIPVKFRSIEQWILYSKKLPENIREAVENEIDELYKSGKIQQIWQKFLVQ